MPIIDNFKPFDMKSLVILLFTHLAIMFGCQAQTPVTLRYFMQAPALPASTIPYGTNPDAGHYITSGDARIYYEIYGKGAPLVILHGGVVGSPYEMGEFIDSLSKYYQVIAISTRGHGKSGLGKKPPTYELKAEDVNAIISSITTDSAIVLGFSDGAYTGSFLAALHPEKIKKLIAIGAGIWDKGFRKFNNTRDLLFGLDSLYFTQQLKMMPQPERFDEWLTTTNQVYNTTEVGQKIFGKIKCPVLMMAGERDQNAPLETVIAAYKMIGHAQLSIIPNAPHPAFLVNFPAVWTSMKPFLDQ